jgi:hypothetical protein
VQAENKNISSNRDSTTSFLRMSAVAEVFATESVNQTISEE